MLKEQTVEVRLSAHAVLCEGVNGGMRIATNASTETDWILKLD